MKETSDRAVTSLKNLDEPFINSESLIQIPTRSKRKPKIIDHVRIEYPYTQMDLSEFKGACMPKNLDVTIFCKEGRYFLNQNKLHKLNDNKIIKIKPETFNIFNFFSVNESSIPQKKIQILTPM